MMLLDGCKTCQVGSKDGFLNVKISADVFYKESAFDSFNHHCHSSLNFESTFRFHLCCLTRA